MDGKRHIKQYAQRLYVISLTFHMLINYSILIKQITNKFYIMSCNSTKLVSITLCVECNLLSMMQEYYLHVCRYEPFYCLIRLP